jgi:hypothetical protein
LPFSLLAGVAILATASSLKPTFAAEEQPDPLPAAREALGAMAEERLADLASRSPGRPLEVALAGPPAKGMRPRVQLLSGERLASSDCVLAAGALGPEPRSTESYAETVRCFLRDNHAVYLEDAEGLDFSFLAARRSGPGPEPGEVMVELQQVHGGVDVKQGDLKAFFIDGELVSVSGSPLDPRGFPSPGLAREAALLAQGRALVAGPIRKRELYFDAEARRFVLVAEDADRAPGQRREHLIDAETGALIATRPAGHRSGETVEDYWTRDYPDGVWWWPGGWGSWSQRTAPAYCSDVGGTGNCATGAGICRFFPHREPGRGDYVTAASAVSRNALGQDVRTRVFSDTLCANDPFDSWSWPDYNFFVTNASYYLNDLADVKNHNFSFFSGYAHTKYPIHLLMVDHNVGGAGVYYPGSHELAFEQSRWPNNNLPNGAELLGTVAHEYGHYIHETYGLRGTQDLIEGWADQNMYRYAVHKKFVSNEWPLMEYLQWGRRHTQTFVNEEAVLETYPNPGDQNHIFPGANCNPNTWDPYGCGAPIGEIYWELAFDRCRMGFGTCAEGQDVVQSGGYHWWAWAMTNSAYAYALSMATSGTDTRAFFSLVADRYAQFQSQYNFLSPSDLERVYSVLSHHCLGPRQRCSTNAHRLPGSRMPSALTHKRLFHEGESRTGSAGPIQVRSLANAASANQSLLFGVGGIARYRVTTPAAGNYKLRFVGRPTSTTDDQIAVWSGEGWLQSAPCTPARGNWAWCDGPVVSLPYGAQDLWLGTAYGGTCELDAFVLVRQ